jgi:hypothetical protein
MSGHSFLPTQQKATQGSPQVCDFSKPSVLSRVNALGLLSAATIFSARRKALQKLAQRKPRPPKTFLPTIEMLGY